MTTTTALIIVDVQPDFCEGGALGVTGGNAVADGISIHVRDAVAKTGVYDLIVASLDWHAPAPDTNCGHFALDGEPDFVTSWPVHCVAGTEGAGFHPAVMDVWDDGLIDDVVRKGYGTQSYSAFEGVGDRGHSLLALLRSNGVTDIDVCGIATDYCVKATVLDALGTGFRVRVLADLVAGVAPASTNQAFTDMMKAGAGIVRNGVHV